MAQLEQLPRAASSGWIAGRHDPRDFTLMRETPLTQRVIDALDWKAKAAGKVSKYTLDLKAFGPVRNQRSLNACCAFAGVSLMEYRVRRDRELRDATCSVGFLYKVTRDLMKKDGQANTDGNVPTDSRTTMKAMTMVGVAPDSMFPTSEHELDREPDLLTYALAANYKATSYWRLDVGGMAGEGLLKGVKRLLLGDLPLMFTVHFFAPTSVLQFAKDTASQETLPVPSRKQVQALKTRQAVERSLIPSSGASLSSASAGEEPIAPQARASATMRKIQEALGLGQADTRTRSLAGGRPKTAAPQPIGSFVGHALVACGFDDKKRCLLVRNSWSAEWGNADGHKGYGWLPYEYLLKGLTEDWWFISDVSFVDPRIFAAMPAPNVIV